MVLWIGMAVVGSILVLALYYTVFVQIKNIISKLLSTR